VAVGVTFLVSVAAKYGQENGVVAAYVSLTWLAVIFLMAYLQGKYRLWNLRDSIQYLWRLTLAIIVAMLSMEGCFLLVSMLGVHGFIGDFLNVGVVALAGMVTYFIIAGLLKMQEISELGNWFSPLWRAVCR